MAHHMCKTKRQLSNTLVVADTSTPTILQMCHGHNCRLRLPCSEHVSQQHTLIVRPCLGFGPQLASGLGRNLATLFALALLPAPWALLKLAFNSGCFASSLPAAMHTHSLLHGQALSLGLGALKFAVKLVCHSVRATAALPSASMSLA